MKHLVFLFLSCSLFGCGDYTDNNSLPTGGESPDSREANIDALLAGRESLNQGEFSTDKMLANIGMFVVAPTVNRLSKRIHDLDQVVNQHCLYVKVAKEISKEDLSELRIPLQEKWKLAVESFHHLEMMNFGPTKGKNSTVMDTLYFFDGEDKCRVDLSLLQLDLRGTLPRTDIISNYNVRGLDAMEPLIFADPDKSRCDRVNPRLRALFEKSLLEREKLSCHYQKFLLKEMVEKTRVLARAWDPKQLNFTREILRGALGTPVEAMNQISQSLFHLDTAVKDKRLAYPAGFDVEIDDVVQRCPVGECAKRIPHLYSNYSLKGILNSLEGFRYLFKGIDPVTGKNGFGFDDLLSSRGHEGVAARLNNALENAIEKISSLSSDRRLSEMLSGYDIDLCESSTSTDRKVEACALVADLRGVTNLLKNEYLLALAELRAPRDAQGDND